MTRLTMAGVLTLAVAFMTALPQMARAQAAYTVLTGLQWDEGFGQRANAGGSDSGSGTGAAGTWTDGMKAWAVNRWAGGWLTVSSTLYPVLSNTGTILTVTGTPPAGPVAYTLAGGWRGWNVLGPTDMPYDFCDEYPADDTDLEINRITLDTQDINKNYPHCYSQLGDTGRIIRMQITNGGIPLDLTGATIQLKSWDVDNGAVRRNDISIADMASYDADGWIEWRLSATDTAENNYFRLKIIKGGTAYYLPNEGYLYIDIVNYQTVEFDGSVRPILKIKSDTYVGDETLSNTALTSGTDWSATFDMALVGDAAVYTYNIGFGQLSQAAVDFAIPAVGNSWYKLTYAVTSGFAALADVTIPTSFAAVQQTLNVLNGTHTLYFMTAASPGGFAINVSETVVVENFTLDNISLKQVHGRVLRFRFMQDRDTAIDMTGIVNTMYLAKLLPGGPVVEPFFVIGQCTSAGYCTFDFSVAAFIGAGKWLMYFKFLYPSGEVIYNPARDYIILEVS